MEKSEIKNQLNSPNAELSASDVRMLPIEEMKKWYEKMTEFGKEIKRKLKKAPDTRRQGSGHERILLHSHGCS